MTPIKKILVLFLVLASVTGLLFTEEINVNSLLRESFYSSDTARRDRDNQDPESLKITAKKLTPISITGELLDRGFITGNTVVFDSGAVPVTEIPGNLEEGKVEVIGDNAFVNIKNITHQIPISLSGGSEVKTADTLTKYEKRNIENSLAESINEYGITPSVIMFKQSSDSTSYKILILKSPFTGIIWMFGEFPIITRIEDLKPGKNSSLYAYNHREKYGGKGR